MRSRDLLLGVDLGSTKIAVSVWTRRGRREASRSFATLPGGPAPNIEAIIGLARELGGGAAFRAVGVSAGGPTDPDRGVVLTIPNQRGWEDVPLGPELSGLLDAPVGVENDANAGALAEWRFGAGRGIRDLAFLTLSTGLGAGLILDGRLYRGARFLAGEVGHQVIEPGGAPCGCGRLGCLEAYASGAGMARQLAELRRRDRSVPADARELVEKARRGDAFSRQFLRQVAGHLARGIANLVFLLNPRRIILGTIAVAAGDLLLRPLREELDRAVWPSLREGLDVVPAALGRDLGDHAAHAVAKETLSDLP